MGRQDQYAHRLFAFWRNVAVDIKSRSLQQPAELRYRNSSSSIGSGSAETRFPIVIVQRTKRIWWQELSAITTHAHRQAIIYPSEPATTSTHSRDPTSNAENDSMTAFFQTPCHWIVVSTNHTTRFHLWKPRIDIF